MAKPPVIEPHQLRHALKVASVKGQNPVRDVALLLTFYSTGVMPNEAAKILVSDYLEANGRVRVESTVRAEKLGLPEAKRAVQSITYNVTGSNARINHHSVDNSTNVVAEDGELREKLTALRREVQAWNLPGTEQQAALDVVDAVDAQFSGGKPKRTVVAALLAALPQVANVATIASAIATFAH